VYGAFINTLGFLFETPSGSHRLAANGTKVVAIPREETYKHQVRGQYVGQRELIRFAAERGAEVRKLLADARARAIARGYDDSDNDQIVLEYRQVNRANEDFWVRAGGGRGGRAGAGGARAGGAAGGAAAGGAAAGGRAGAAGQQPQGRGAGQPQEITFERVNRPVFTKFEATRTTTRPWGYFIHPGAARVVPLLLDQQITVQRLTEPLTVDLEVYYATEVRADQYFQGHYLRAVKADKRTEKMTLPAGTLFVPSGQARSNLVSYLLEPETDDNLVTWGYLDDFVRVTPPATAAPQAAANPDPDDPPQAPPSRQGQQIPLFRLMKQTPFKSVIVQRYEGPDRNRYYR
jgi:hypothetical protein